RLGDGADHPLERRRELADLVLRLLRRLGREVAARDRLRALGDPFERAEEAPGVDGDADPDAERQGREQRELEERASLPGAGSLSEIPHRGVDVFGERAEALVGCVLHPTEREQLAVDGVAVTALD